MKTRILSLAALISFAAAILPAVSDAATHASIIAI
jgi:hypothetical protein